MTWQNIIFNKIILALLPIHLRHKTHRLWLECLLYPLQWISERILYKMQHTSQVIYLEKFLNEFFQVQGYDKNRHQETKKVFIIEGYAPDKVYIFKRQEQKPIYLSDPVFISLYQDYKRTYADFIVRIPQEYAFDPARLRAEINYYKLAGKDYKIEKYRL